MDGEGPSLALSDVYGDRQGCRRRPRLDAAVGARLLHPKPAVQALTSDHPGARQGHGDDVLLAEVSRPDLDPPPGCHRQRLCRLLPWTAERRTHTARRPPRWLLRRYRAPRAT